ncbi:MAG: hypothetical protein IH614_02155 [Desulfuromonadales bacterium]|nr:hypothetical protein [Desulfuromonadales bacterium]
MDPNEYQDFCQAVEAGETKYVENTGSHDQGRVLFCSGNRLEVEIGDRRETWGVEYCKEVKTA